MPIVTLPSRLGTWRQDYLNVLRADPCAYCPARASGTVDHIVARARGGTSALSNLTGACERCNGVEKGDESLLLFLLDRSVNIRPAKDNGTR